MVKKIALMFLVLSFGANVYSYSTANNENDSLAIIVFGGSKPVKEGFTHPGLFLFRASLAIGGMTGLKANNVFVEGNMEYFIDRRVSLRGDGYFFGGHTGNYKPFKFHHSLFTGAMFHKYTNGDFDPYAGLEVGINYAQATDQCLGGICTAVVAPEPVKATFSPLFSPVVGFNYYGGKFFHLTVHARYILGTFMDNYNVASLSEWRISFGLGFNLSKKLIGKQSSANAIW